MTPTRSETGLTGAAGAVALVCSLATMPLYFVYSGPPPAWDVLTRNLVTIVALTAMTVFLTGLVRLIRSVGPAYDWPASLIGTAGTLYLAVGFVAISLEAGPAIADPGRRIDPTTTGPLAVGDILLHGSVQRAITALLTFAIAAAVLRGGCLPRPLGWLALAVGVANLCCVPSLFFGADAARFYSALGWGNSAVTAGLFGLWAGVAGIVTLRRAVTR